jgi:hypothetical protein
MAKNTKISCRKKTQQRYYKKNKKKLLAYSKNWCKNHPDKYAVYKRKYLLKVTYGITLEQYNEMLHNQKGVCAICSQSNRNGRPLVIDHDHKTGNIRGLLCDKCNPVLGYVDENIKTLNKMITYLIDWR